MEKKPNSSLEDMRKVERRLKISIIIFSGFLFFAITLLGIFKISTSSFLCNACHEMRPEVITWKSSSHNKIECASCHLDYKLKSTIKYENKLISMIYKHFSKKYYLPIEIKEQVKNSMCNNCHDMSTKIVTATGDIIIPHLRHEKQNLPCIKCHSGVVHAKVADRQLTIDGDFVRWNEEMAKENMIPAYMKTPMKTCMDCHKSKKVTRKCSACHTAIDKPKDHFLDNWWIAHGVNARKKISYCNRCHSLTQEKDPLDEGFNTKPIEPEVFDPKLLGVSEKKVLAKGQEEVSEIKKYIKENNFCYECHEKRPITHGITWTSVHFIRAISDKEGCLVCHSFNPKPLGNGDATTNCGKCHIGKHQGVPKLHPVPVNLAKRGGAVIGNTCSACHLIDKCAECHQISRPSPKQRSKPRRY